MPCPAERQTVGEFLCFALNPVFENVDGDGKNNGGILLYSDFGQSLQIAQLQGYGLFAYYPGSLART
jgi:hypothetical protein